VACGAGRRKKTGVIDDGAVDKSLEIIVRVDLMLPIEDEDEGDELPPLALHWPFDYVLTTWLDHKRHGIYPAPGGYDSQDAQLVKEDWPQITVRYNRIYRQLQGERGEHDGFDALMKDAGRGAGDIDGWFS
jgi:hypothetical protein